MDMACAVKDCTNRVSCHTPTTQYGREDDDEDLSQKEKCYVVATADGYLVITLMSKNALNDTVSYLGQAVVNLADYEDILYHGKDTKDQVE